MSAYLSPKLNAPFRMTSPLFLVPSSKKRVLVPSSDPLGTTGKWTDIRETVATVNGPLVTNMHLSKNSLT